MIIMAEQHQDEVYIVACRQRPPHLVMKRIRIHLRCLDRKPTVSRGSARSTKVLSAASPSSIFSLIVGLGLVVEGS